MRHKIRGMKRICYLGLGHICMALGIAGVILPVMPGFVFFLVAAWAYGRSSERFRKMLIDHPKLGPAILRWEEYRVVPKKAKFFAGLMMGMSLALCSWRAESWHWPAVLAVIMALIMGYLLACPSRVPYGQLKKEKKPQVKKILKKKKSS
jgi:uncharacterized membrane protein YbaN (DUF454 family)